MVKKFFLWLFIHTLSVVSATAQFKIERIPNTLIFEPPKTFSLYTNSHFNRVEALYLDLGVKVQPSFSKPEGTAPALMLYGEVGYGFKNEEKKRPRWTAGLQKEFRFPSRLTLGAEYFYKIETNDRWMISDIENSLAGIWLHEDFMDYFDKKGVRAFADFQLGQVHTLRLDASGHHYETLQRNTNWSVFSGWHDKSYPPNPRIGQASAFGIQTGDEFSIKLIAAFDWRDNPIFPNTGWQAEGYYERTGNDFETNGLFLTVKRYQPTFSDQKLLAKVMFGTRAGSFAYQHLLNLGGLSSLRGYRDKEFTGNRLLFVNGTYVIGQAAFGGFLRKLPLHYIPLWEATSLGFFAEAGYAWLADPQNSDVGLFDFGSFSINDLRSDVGISLLVTEGLLRVDFAKRTDRGYDDWRVTFRILDRF